MFNMELALVHGSSINCIRMDKPRLTFLSLLEMRGLMQYYMRCRLGVLRIYYKSGAN